MQVVLNYKNINSKEGVALYEITDEKDTYEKKDKKSHGSYNYCPYCSSELEGGFKYCPNCGKEI